MADADILDEWNRPEFIGEFNTFGVPYGPMGPAIERTGLVGDHAGTMIVETAAGDPIGTVSWHAVVYGPNAESRAYNIGINLIPDARFKGYGAVAQRLLADHLLATTPVNRIEAMTDVENLAEQRALAKAGFSREGILLGAQHRAGRWHDLVVYSLVREPGSAAP